MKKKLVILFMTCSLVSLGNEFNSYIGIQKAYASNKNNDLLKKYISEGNSNKIKELIGKGANVNTIAIIRFPPIGEKREYNSLILATIMKDKNFIKFLLGKGANINYKEPYTLDSALGIACKLGDLDTVKLLVKNKAEMHYPSDNSPLFISVTYGQLEILKYLIESGANINSKNDYGWSLLYFTNSHADSMKNKNNRKISEYLTKKGAKEIF